VAGLAWWRLREAAPENALRPLHDAARYQALQAALLEAQLEQAFAVLRAAGVEPILGKGWAAARLYPAPGLRPCGDIDLYLPAPQTAMARGALIAAKSGPLGVDLHEGFAEIDDRPAADLYRRSRTVRLGSTDVRVFGPEDHLRLLVLHMLRHGGWRPLWLCDVAAAVESEAVDGEALLSGDGRRTDWLACGLVLARELLGASLDGLPGRVRERRLPRWLGPTVLGQWGNDSFQPQGRRTPMADVPVRQWAAALRQRWPNGVEATVGLHGPFNGWPRLPFQLAECARRVSRVVRA
jgi:putative nucleotidyltransferase-like protein